MLEVSFGQCSCNGNSPSKGVFIAHVGQQVCKRCRCVDGCHWYLQIDFCELLLCVRFVLVFMPSLTSKFPSNKRLQAICWFRFLKKATVAETPFPKKRQLSIFHSPLPVPMKEDLDRLAPGTHPCTDQLLQDILRPEAKNKMASLPFAKASWYDG